MSDTDKIRRWNFEADDEGLLVCKGGHEKSEHCEAHMERLSPHEVLKIINALRAGCLEQGAISEQLLKDKAELVDCLIDVEDSIGQEIGNCSDREQANSEEALLFRMQALIKNHWSQP